jgi:hypothetical protein
MPKGGYKAVAAVATPLWGVSHLKQNCKNCSQSRGYRAAFTLVELSVSMGVLVLLVFLFTQLLNSAATITILGHKQMDADSQARQVLDRVAVDFAQMVKRYSIVDLQGNARSDVDYYLKSPQVGTPDCTTCTAQTSNDLNRNDPTGNDQIAFFASTSGYYPAPSNQSPISLVAYRVNSGSNKMERMGKGFIWNGVSSTYVPILFLDSTTTPNTTIASQWPAAINSSMADPDGNYETVGPQVFRFEYYYLLKGQTDPTTSITYPSVFSVEPWDKRITGHTNVSGMRDVTAIAADIAVIDPKSKLLVADLAGVAASLVDVPFDNTTYQVTLPAGGLLAQWRMALDTSGLPPATISGIRVYERYFYLTH